MSPIGAQSPGIQSLEVELIGGNPVPLHTAGMSSTGTQSLGTQSLDPCTQLV